MLTTEDTGQPRSVGFWSPGHSVVMETITDSVKEVQEGPCTCRSESSREPQGRSKVSPPEKGVMSVDVNEEDELCVWGAVRIPDPGSSGAQVLGSCSSPVLVTQSTAIAEVCASLGLNISL